MFYYRNPGAPSRRRRTDRTADTVATRRGAPVRPYLVRAGRWAGDEEKGPKTDGDKFIETRCRKAYPHGLLGSEKSLGSTNSAFELPRIFRFYRIFIPSAFVRFNTVTAQFAGPATDNLPPSAFNVL